MKIEAKDSQVEALFLDVFAMRMAMRRVITLFPSLAEEVRFIAEHTPAALLPSTMTDQQIERIRDVLLQLTEAVQPPKTP